VRLSPPTIARALAILAPIFAFASQLATGAADALPQRWLPQSAALLALFALVGLFLPRVDRVSFRLVLFSLQLGVVWVSAVPIANPFVLGFPLVVGIIIESSVLLRLAPAVVVGLTGPFLVATAPSGIPAYGRLVPLPSQGLTLLFLVTGVLITLLAIGLRRVFDRSVEAQGYRRRLEEAMFRLAETNMQLQQYGAMAEQHAAEQERKRISQDVHDILGHTLSTVNMTLQASLSVVDTSIHEGLYRMLSGAREQVKEGIQELRKALAVLDSVPYKAPYGKASILQLARNVSQATGITIDVDFADMGAISSEELAAIIYRLVQEGITNAIRHGNATHIDIHFQRTDGGIRLYVRDNGRGLGESQPGFGLKAMEDRISSVDGSLEVTGHAQGGTLLTAWFPDQKEGAATDVED
jgi:signal transduction histidine kinase